MLGFFFYDLVTIPACSLFWGVITRCRLERPRVTSSLVIESKNSWSGWRKNCYHSLPPWNDKCLENSQNDIEVPKKVNIYPAHKSFRSVSSWIWLFFCWFLLFDWVFADRWPLTVLIKTTYVEWLGCIVIGEILRIRKENSLPKNKCLFIHIQFLLTAMKLFFFRYVQLLWSGKATVWDTEELKFVGQTHFPATFHWSNKEKCIFEFDFNSQNPCIFEPVSADL